MFVCLQICLFFLDLLVFIRIMKVFLEVFVYIRMVIFFINMFVHIWIIEYFIIMLVFLRNYQVLVNWLMVSQFNCFEAKLSSVSLRFCWFSSLFVCLRTVFLDLVGAESNIFVGFAVVCAKVEFDKVVIFVWHLWLFVHVFVSMSDNFTISKLVQIGSLM